jgi:alginate O-acetyltransferase complex protein AlgI
MVFSSLEFLIRFLPAFLLVYFLVPSKLKNLLLLIASLFFYAWGEPVYVVLMVVSCIGNYFFGLDIENTRGTKRSKNTLIVSVVFNVSLLGFFKYADFIIETVNTLVSSKIALLGLPLPIGISFYTFQAISYTVDVYRNNAPVQRDLISLATYIAMFPQLVAGPIVRYPTIADEINERKPSLDLFSEGVHRFVLGLGKKVLIANNIGQVWEMATATSNPSVLMSWLGILAFAFQIYFDFSGYSDMAIGLGRMLGFHLPENFNFPYISQSVTEFWRRWHMSLGRWFRNFVYIPLGGNRVSRLNWVRNVVTVWFLTGLWHGASWNFISWGIYFGVILMVEKLILRNLLEKLPGLVRHVYTLGIVLVSWVIFQLPSIASIQKYLGNMFGLNGIEALNAESLYTLKSNLLLLVVAAIASVPLFRNVYNKYSEDFWFRGLLMPILYALILVVSVAYIVDSSFNPFLYFRF